MQAKGHLDNLRLLHASLPVLAVTAMCSMTKAQACIICQTWGATGTVAICMGMQPLASGTLSRMGSTSLCLDVQYGQHWL